MTADPGQKTHLSIATGELLSPYGLDIRTLEAALSHLMSRRIDYGDLYLQKTTSESWRMENGIVAPTKKTSNLGLGARAMVSERTAYAFTRVLEKKSILNTVSTARSISSRVANGALCIREITRPRRHYPPANPMEHTPDADKISILEHLEEMARMQNPKVGRVATKLSSVYQVILIVNSDGNLAVDVRPLFGIQISVSINSDSKFGEGYAALSRRTLLSSSVDTSTLNSLAREAVRTASVDLAGVPVAGGQFPVVLGSGAAGSLVHESIGHGLEADFNLNGESVFSSKLGERVADSQCTIVDDGTLEEERGSLSIDDEGSPARQTVLIENGRLANYMHDIRSARLLGMMATGNGRRESFTHTLLPRMTNTYLLPGKYDTSEILRSVDKGIYARKLRGGRVDIASGKFALSAGEAYLIEKGKVTQPLKNLTLVGDGSTALSRISLVGNDLQFDPGVGSCRKAGQIVPIGAGQPTVKIDRLLCFSSRLRP